MKELKLRVSHTGKWIVEAREPLSGQGIKPLHKDDPSRFVYYATDRALKKLEERFTTTNDWNSYD